MRATGLLALVALPAVSSEYVSYLGGKFTDSAFAIATDASGNSYVAGASHSPDFPEAPGFTSGDRDKNTIAFVAKFNPDGRLLWRAFVGGPAGDSTARAIAVESGGSVIIAGSTTNPATFPFSAGTAATGFVARLSADGATLLRAVGVAAWPEALAIDSSGAVYIAGSAGPDLPTTPGAYQASLRPGDCSFERAQTQCADAFAIKLSRNLDIAYATYLGGSDDETAYGIAVDSSGAAWLVGRTASADFPVSTSVPFGGWIVIGPNHEGDAFAAQLSPDGKNLRFATFLGGPQCGSRDGRRVGRVWIGVAGRSARD